MLIAIDGPAGAGKSTVARAVADALGFTYLDSGAMYRSVALVALRRGIALDDAAVLGALTRELVLDPLPGKVMLDGENVTASIRAPEVGDAASQISVHPQVRGAMLDRQRALIATGRYVAEGRDVGTVVAPDAELKVFLTADEDERVRRRAEQSGEAPEKVREMVQERDRRDSEREHAPLHAAEDAVEVDTTGLDPEEVTERIVELARERGLA